MRILQINSVCGIGSTGRICTDLASSLTEHGHECKIAFGRGTVSEKHQKYAVYIGSEVDTKIHALSSRVFDCSGFLSKSATNNFLKWIDSYNPDVIHLHNLHGYYINIELLFNYLKKCGKKIIWTMHDCWAFTGHCACFEYINCEKWKSVCCNCPLKNNYPKSIFLDNSTRNYMRKKDIFTAIPNLTIITPSQWLKGLLKQSFLKDYPVEVIHNGIDTDVFKPISSDFRKIHGLEDKTILLGVANLWGKKKGINDFIKLANMLDSKYQIVMVGVSKRQIKQMPKKILCFEHTNSVKELAEIYSAADIFLNPTYEDNYPTVNIEALACGTPIITYNTGGSAECIDNDLCISVDKGNIDKFISAIYSFNKKIYYNSYIDRSQYGKLSFCKKYLQVYNRGKF